MIVIHTAGRAHASNVSQEIFGFYGRLGGWAVPIFVMISGALFLSKDILIKKIYSKYVFRIFTVFLSWSVVYALAVYRETKQAENIIPNIITGHYHMWFLPMIAAMYMLVPILKKLTESEMLTKYFLVLSLIFAFALPQAANIISLFSDKYGEAVKKLVNNFYMSSTLKYTGYFVFGHFLSISALSAREKHIIYALGIFSFIISILVRQMGIVLWPLFEASAIFILFKEHCPENQRLRELFVLLGKYSLGVYLVHEAVLQLLRKLGLDVLSFSPMFSVPVISIATFIISFAISTVLNHIPVLKKYIV